MKYYSKARVVARIRAVTKWIFRREHPHASYLWGRIPATARSRQTNCRARTRNTCVHTHVGTLGAPRLEKFSKVSSLLSLPYKCLCSWLLWIFATPRANSLHSCSHSSSHSRRATICHKKNLRSLFAHYIHYVDYCSIMIYCDPKP